MRLVAGIVGLGALSLVLTACESTAQKSAELAKHAAHLAQGNVVRVTTTAADVKVVSTTALHDVNGTAVVVAVRSSAKAPLYALPIAATALDAAGTKVGANDAAGLDPSLTHIAQVPPGQVTYWVDDQLPTTGTPATAKATVGTPASSGAALPALTLSAPKLENDPSSGLYAGGTLHNGTAKTLASVNVTAVALKGTTVIAGGRGSVTNVAPGASIQYEVFFIGNPTGGRLVLSAAPGSAG